MNVNVYKSGALGMKVVFLENKFQIKFDIGKTKIQYMTEMLPFFK